MADALVLFLVFGYSVFLIIRMMRRRGKGASGCGCSGSCATCRGCSSEYIDKLLKSTEKTDGR